MTPPNFAAEIMDIVLNVLNNFIKRMKIYHHKYLVISDVEQECYHQVWFIVGVSINFLL